MNIEMEATEIRPNRYAVRPKGQLGTCGSYPFLWTVIFVNANSEQQALGKATKKYENHKTPNVR